MGGTLAVDAGALASGLSLPAQQRVRTVLLTHQHFDHLQELPLFLDNVGAAGVPPVAVGAEGSTTSNLFRHVFNDKLWPDLRRFHPPQAQFFKVRPGKVFVRHAIRITPLRTHHTVPTLGYVFRRQGAAAAILGDTGYRKQLFQALARTAGLGFLVIETSYPSYMEELAGRARHLTPDLLAEGLEVVRRSHPRLRVLVNHLKPPWARRIEHELGRLDPPVMIARDGETHRFLP